MDKPYEIGDRFTFLGCGPFVITGRFNPAKPEYTAEYAGPKWQAYWKCDRFSHNLIRIICN